ncbi:MAG: Ppx/GppA family phosphatase, partial [Clostridiaceae bacterium]|nr:Ppx/GppA family phosphatase [Clostridiaceae bacterium]
GNITPKGMKENLEAFQVFVTKAKAYGAEAIHAIATSAVRDAANGKEFVELALEKTGIKVEVIDGATEATLGYQGVLMGLKEAGETTAILVIDIGGGSTEFILGKGDLLQEVVSENVGAVRMTERIITTDPVTPEEEKSLHLAIEKEINPTLQRLKEKDIKKLIGIGGTITTLAALHQELEVYDMEKVHNYSLTLTDIEYIHQKLKNLPLEERKNLKGIHPKRADIILAGVTILIVAMEKLGLEEITVSEYDNLEGLLRECI